MNASFPFSVILYYKYVRIEEPKSFVYQHRLLCESLNLKGRILVSGEGINGTLAGEVSSILHYQNALKSDPRFSDIDFKISCGNDHTFPKLMIKVRDEIVTLGLQKDVDPIVETATHLSPQEWKKSLDELYDELYDDLVIFDIRNRYESELGYFNDAIKFDIEHFRDLPEAIDNYTHLKNKKVMMYCTGGIRCEKAGALLKKRGFREVYQLSGGIINYLKKIGRKHWSGDCFVFDQRMVLPDAFAISKEPVGRCEHTGVRTRNIVNCENEACRRLFLISPDALKKQKRAMCFQCCQSVFDL